MSYVVSANVIEVICVLISSAATIACAIIAYKAEIHAKEAREERAEAERCAARRVRESMLSLKLMNANCALTIGTALAIKRGRANGELEDGLKKVQEAQDEYEDFLKTIALEDLENNHSHNISRR